MKTMCIAVTALALGLAGCNCGTTSHSKPAAPSASPAAHEAHDDHKHAAVKQHDEIVLFDGVSLKNWKSTNFGGEGDVEIEKGQLIMTRGSMLTGVTWTGPELPKTNYEVTLEAMRVEGGDFFCGIAFPVGESSASFVAGGWGGSTCGISLIDGEPAIDNETFYLHSFDNKKWYNFCLRVTPEKIQVWIDDFPVVDFKTADRQIAIHPSMEASLPFGLACYGTMAAYRNVKLRKLD